MDHAEQRLGSSALANAELRIDVRCLQRALRRFGRVPTTFAVCAIGLSKVNVFGKQAQTDEQMGLAATRAERRLIQTPAPLWSPV